MISDNYTLEEFFDYKNFSSGFLREVEDCIEVVKMNFLLCANDEGGMEIVKGNKHVIANYIQNKALLAYVLDWIEKSEVGDLLETGNYIIVRLKA